MRNKLIIAFFSLAFLAFFAGCSLRQPHFRVGVSQCLDDAWRQKMNDEMDRELLLHPELELHHRVAYGSNTLQCAQIDSFIAERVDLLIVSPNEGAGVRPAISRAYRAGIPVIVADRRVSGEEWTAFIGGDNYKVGHLMAEWIAEIQSEQREPIHVLEVCGLPGSTPAARRHTGMMQRLQALEGIQPQIVSLPGEWYKENAYQVVKEYLRTHKDVDAIVAQNDLMAIGASEAVRDSRGYGEGSVRIMGVDGILPGLQAIADHEIECSATYPSRGDLLIETAVRILTHKPFVRDTVLETTMVNAATAEALLIQYKERQHDIETLQLLQLQTDAKWQRIQTGRWISLAILAAVMVLFFGALAYLISFQFYIQTEIKKTILPQLAEVQEAIQVSQKDIAFAERMKQIVDDHLTDPNLSVEYLGSALQLSRTQIFRRVKTITGKGPLDYIRERRLIRADELLRTTDMTIQQVALEFCFSNPGYFTKCYKEYFGHLPSER